MREGAGPLTDVGETGGAEGGGGALSGRGHEWSHRCHPLRRQRTSCKVFVSMLGHPNLEKQMWRYFPVSFVNVSREVTNALLFDHGLNLLEDVREIKWVKLCHLEHPLMRNDNEIRASLPGDVEVRQTTLIVQMSRWWKLLFSLRTIPSGWTVTRLLIAVGTGCLKLRRDVLCHSVLHQSELLVFKSFSSNTLQHTANVHMKRIEVFANGR